MRARRGGHNAKIKQEEMAKVDEGGR